MNWIDLALLTWNDIPLLARLAILAWLISMVVLPFWERFGSEWATRRGVIIGVLLQDLAVLAVLSANWGWGHTLWGALLVAVLGWGVEWAGSHTGIPFGRYHYTPLLQPQVGRVPLAVPLAWLMMLPPAWAVAARITAGSTWAFILLSALAMTAWDFFLDPQMVSWGFWQWEHPGGYCLRCKSGGIPWSNFAGWALASGLITAIMMAVGWLRPAQLPLAPLMLIYALVWVLQTVGLGIFWKQPFPAMIGFVSMGSMLLCAWSS